jgi:DNA-binding response OmpR family regulator
MALSAERILVVESDPDISDLIARQALKPLGYHISVAPDAASAIRLAVQAPPDLIISNLVLPGLSGKDLLVALFSQGISVPFIVLANTGSEMDVIQAFRLGAADFINVPVREAEVVMAVERVLKQTREGRAREQLDRQLKQTNAELQQRVRELTTIFTIGRAVISVTDQRVLFEKIVEGAVQVSEADMGWLSLRD